MSGLEGKSVVVVEDDEHIAAVLEFIVGRLGCQPRMIADGASARDFIASAAPPDLILLDRMLPQVTGMQLLAQIRARPDWQHTVVAMLSARHDEADVTAARAAGASDYLLKPFEPQQLMERLRALLAPQASGSST
jgi:DNA-binding response OmpR family regulator